MIKQQRQDMIMKLLEAMGSITLQELREQMGISESTIRRDLTEMDAEGKLVKVFGGAMSIRREEMVMRELSVDEKGQVNVEEKKAIGRTAAELIRTDDFVYNDAGTTTGCMLNFITQRGVTYVTNGVSHAKELAGRGLHVILLGGELKGTTEAVIGAQAVEMLSLFHFTKGFFGTNGITKKCGFTTPDSTEAMVKRMAVNQCQSKFILADHSKFNEISAVTFCEFDRAVVISDRVDYEEYRNISNLIIAK